MKYIKQFGIIVIISFISEILSYLIPLPIPASIYGLILMFCCLYFKIFPLDYVKETGNFLIEIMPLMFIPSAVGLLKSWDVLKSMWLPAVVITIVSTIAVMAVSGLVTQAIIKAERKKSKKEHTNE